MITFFRHIRKDLMEKNKTGKYLKYAIGEIILVVIGILIALQINNWNESKKTEKVKSQLIIDMKVELENSQEQLDAMIQIGDSMITQGKLLFAHLNSGDNSISTDALSHLLKSVIKGTPFDLQLPSYDEAKSSGRLSLLNNKDLLLEYSNIFIANEGYELHRKVGTEMYYLGSMWELRKKIGSRQVLTNRKVKLPINLTLTDDEYRQLLVTPDAYAALKNQSRMTSVTIGYLIRMRTSTIKIIKLLDAL